MTISTDQINVILVWTNGKFSSLYVKRLANAIQKSFGSIQCRFTVISDKSVAEVKSCFPDASQCTLQVLDSRPFNLHGYYNKMLVFKHLSDENKCSGDYVYFDLDTLILTDDLTPFIDRLRKEKKFAILKNFAITELGKKHACPYGSAIMYFPEGFNALPIWEGFMSDKKRYLDISNPIGYGDQHIIYLLNPKAIFLQELFPGKIKSFKYPMKMQDKPSKKDGDVWIVCFHGKPSIEEASKEYEWVKTTWKL